MQNPFWHSAGTRFITRSEVLNLARETAVRIASLHTEVVKVLLFGSFAREDYGARSDLDLLIVVRGHPIRSRPAAELRPKPEYRRRILDNSRKGSFAWLNRDTDLR